MLYSRQKFLLSFLMEFGGELSRTDCQKLVFLFCQYYKKDYYDYFPYKYGPFSHILFNDKRILTKRGFLQNSEKFKVAEKTLNSLNETNKIEQKELRTFRKSMQGFRGKKLISKTYSEFPYFSQNSEIVNFNKIPSEEKNTHKSFYSLGYEGKSIDKYLNTLIKNKIEIVYDVRNNPVSRKFGYSKSRLESYLNNVGIRYFHLPGLGIPPKYRRDLDTKSDYEELFSFYRKSIINESLKDLEEIKKSLKENFRIVIICFESDFRMCHRKIVCEFLSNDMNFEAVHL